MYLVNRKNLLAIDELRFLHECKENVKEQQNPFINYTKATVNSFHYETLIICQVLIQLSNIHYLIYPSQ